jgi:hypothetical protein
MIVIGAPLVKMTIEVVRENTIFEESSEQECFSCFFGRSRI